MIISQIPNFLTLLRIVAVPVMVLLLREEAYDLTFYLFVLAGITDGLDGFIAKRFGFETRLGAILDPLADKLLLVTAFVMLANQEHLPFWLPVVVVFRDLLIVSGYLIVQVLQETVQIKPTGISKVNTFLQISLIGAVLVDQAGWLALDQGIDILILTVLVTTVTSGLHYIWVWGFSLNGDD
ncbi:MAG: CDP-alcohol phosphatidyltransferase [Acidiferrobacteraceae bacterium]|jgi:cardiolipin synthase|nr:CDP-alcohol phosphatidyltransferase [Acidiferrobacteraceae bacterium]MDP6122562.1 CDP-alcohol phosphatidyltransferase family protein [Arenicellales bacterium]MDP6435217.1 CDP-alcohol phosphatidyltransferase family protein [Arenicellales bacterium]MDP6671575.1 CDP-alcohol phosphatidyltransferase family protein [Arenicellales bacterium]MDP6724589.1 CDP-alcohol phosphatidyltransferase family protein [Arenicellales bacterium]|tara:strand:+ start:1719 stop:2264 length:546 start_codon:yes stop_codon:yes gene_type:complete